MSPLASNHVGANPAVLPEEDGAFSLLLVALLTPPTHIRILPVTSANVGDRTEHTRPEVPVDDSLD